MRDKPDDGSLLAVVGMFGGEAPSPVFAAADVIDGAVEVDRVRCWCDCSPLGHEFSSVALVRRKLLRRSAAGTTPSRCTPGGSIS
jgi:hypothetical protein